MIAYIPKVCGVIGLLIITKAIFAKNERQQDWAFVAGGLGLLIYSISLKDPIFIPLQIIFIAASLYEILTLKKKQKKKRG